jgi:hypothetical protein
MRAARRPSSLFSPCPSRSPLRPPLPGGKSTQPQPPL